MHNLNSIFAAIIPIARLLPDEYLDLKDEGPDISVTIDPPNGLHTQSKQPPLSQPF
jgi:hypothetical protein